MDRIPPIKQLRRICQDSSGVEEEERHFLAIPQSIRSEQYFRSISIYFTKLFLILSFGANQVTLVNLAVGVCASILYATGRFYFILLGTLLFLLFSVLDHSDGEVARFRGEASLEGHYLDLLVHHIVELGMDVGVALAVYQRSGSVVMLMMGSLMVLLGVVEKYTVSIYYRTIVHHLQIASQMVSRRYRQFSEDRANISEKPLRSLTQMEDLRWLFSLGMLLLLYRYIPIWVFLAVLMDTLLSRINLVTPAVFNIFIIVQVVGRLAVSVIVPFSLIHNREIEKAHIELLPL